MENKIHVAFVYHPCNTLTTNKYFTTHYNFFMNALRRNDEIDISYIKSKKSFDTSSLNNNFDVILLFENANTGDDCVPEDFLGIDKIKIPVIAKVGDPHDAKKFKPEIYHEKYKIDAYFGLTHEELFYKYYPKKYRYKMINIGLEPSLYQNMSPFNKRIKNRILNSGAVANKKLHNRLYSKIFRRENSAMKLYKLRTMCNKLNYIDYTSTLHHKYIGDNYPLLLQKYAASIAAMTIYPTVKYLEIPAAGCLTFMEITEKNRGSYLGFKDGETAIFINEKNYRDKFEEYLNDLNNPKWEKIAAAGRNYVMKNLTNDTAVNSLVELIREYV